MAKNTPFPLRMPPEMRAEIDARAVLQGVSANTVVVGLLADALGMDAPAQEPPAHDLETLIRRVVADEFTRRGL